MANLRAPRHAGRIGVLLLGGVLTLAGCRIPGTDAPPTAAIQLTPAAGESWRSDAPGVHHAIDAAGMPLPYATPSTANPARLVDASADNRPLVPPGFTVVRYAEHLRAPRELRFAPNGDLFVTETRAGTIRVVRPHGAGIETFAEGLDGPFGMAFYPAGDAPQWLYVANRNSVVRFPYRLGDVRARGAAEVLVPRLAATTRGHSTRDVAFSQDGQTLFVSVGSASNVGDGMESKAAAQLAAWTSAHALGAAWGAEEDRALVLAFRPDGSQRHAYATGIRNCVGLAVHPKSGELWCATNERDGLGEDLVPDYVSHIESGAFYGWPWYYLGAHPDPRRKGERPDLALKVTLPDVLLQSHSAPMQVAFYQADAPTAFPEAYRGNAFVTLHGSWNRKERTGYKVVRIALDADGHAGTTGYEDFMTGFVNPDGSVWGRPVGLAVARDGTLLVADDANGIIWRVAATAAAGPPR